MSMRKISHVFGLRTSRNPQNRQISHYRYVWGQSRSMTLDDLRKVQMQSQRSDVVMCWSKQTCIRLIPNQSIQSRENVEIIRLSHTESLECISANQFIQAEKFICFDSINSRYPPKWFNQLSRLNRFNWLSHIYRVSLKGWPSKIFVSFPYCTCDCFDFSRVEEMLLGTLENKDAFVLWCGQRQIRRFA